MNEKRPAQKIEVAVRMAVDVKVFAVDQAQYTFDPTTSSYRVWSNVTTIVVPLQSLVYLHILA